MSKSNRIAIVVVAISVMLGGCSSGIKKIGKEMSPLVGSPENAKSFTPPAGKCGVYVIRESNVVGAAVYWRVYLDIEPLAAVGNNSYVYAVVDPGVHNIQVIYETEEGKTFQAVAGRNYFFLMGISNTGHVTPISEEEGKAFVERFKGS